MITLKFLNEPTSLFNLINDNRDHLQPWFPWVNTTNSIADSNNFIHSSNGRHWGVFFNNKHVGMIGIVNIYLDENVKTCELGFWLDRHHQGKGIMKETCIALIDKIFLNSDIKLITIKTQTHNKRCINLMNSLSFSKCINQSTECVYQLDYHDWIHQSYSASEKIVPTLDPDVILRTHEAIAYNKRLGKIYYLNAEGEAIIRIIEKNTNKNIIEITNELTNQGDDELNKALLVHKAIKFINKCINLQLMRKCNVR